MTALSQGIVCASAERASDAATDLRRVAESATPSPGQLVPAVKPEVSDPKLHNIVDNLYKRGIQPSTGRRRHYGRRGAS